MAISYNGCALPPPSETVMLLNTSCRKPQEERVLLSFNPAYGLPIEAPAVRSGYWTKWAIGLI